MKNLSLVLNGILAIAVGILFYQVNTLKHNTQAQENTGKEETVIKPVITANSTNLGDAKIAYVNTDSINEHYNYIADFTKVLKSKKATLEAQMESMSMKFQKEYQEFQQSAQAGIMPQAELLKQQQSLERQQQELANKELQMQNLGLELEEKNIELNKNVKDFLKRFNDGKFDYILSYSDMVPTILLTNPKLDITNAVLQGLNDEYAAKKGKK